jgi:NADH dehydrogenase FAD-containing subunit
VQPLDKSKPVQQVPFDILVAATGFSFPTILETPGQSKEERQKEVDDVSSAILSGNKVVIAGGGVTGVEFVADLLEEIPEEKRKGAVTLVCSSEELLAGQPSHYREVSKKVLEDLGAEIIFNDRVSSHDETTISSDSFFVELKSGKTLECHAFIPSYARGPNSGWLKSSGEGDPLPSDLLDERGKVVVDDYLQSTVYDKLYAIGAVNSLKEAPVFMNVDEQAKTVGANIANPKSKKHKPGVENAVYQKVGTETYAMLIPENMPAPGLCNICCYWCGFPCNLLCPCFCCAICLGVDPMTCGTCCGPPEGKGFAKTLKWSKEKNMAAEGAGYVVKGKSALGAPPESSEMDRS